MENKPPGPSLKDLRIKRSLSQSDVAEAIGTTANTISRWERGITTPSFYYRRKIGGFFEVDPQAIFFYSSNQEEDKISTSTDIPLEEATAESETRSPVAQRQGETPSPLIRILLEPATPPSSITPNVMLNPNIGPSWRWHRWAKAGGCVGLITIIIASIVFSTIIHYNVLNQISSDEWPSIGLCDGQCVLDVDRLNGSLKRHAANELQETNELPNDYLKYLHHNAACAYLNWARKEDQTDAEAKIDYENQCGGDDFAPLRCPCINYVAAIALAKEKASVDAKNTADTDPAIYNNGMSRSILQAVYLQQKAWNKAHKNGPLMYIFVASVGDVSDTQHASQWQQRVAQQIISLHQAGSEHHINGVVGLLQGKDSLVGPLNQNAIPMISVASLSNNNSTNQPYLLSVAPSIETEMSAAVHFLSKNIVKNKNSIHAGIFFYKSKEQYQTMASTFESLLPGSDKWDDQTYDSLPQTTSSDVEHLAEQAAGSYDAIFFAGPVNDLLTFIKKLRETDPTVPVLACNTANQSVYYYQPPSTRKSLQNLYFTAFAYHDTEKYTLTQRSSMISEFNQTYDPESAHSGDIYTYQLPSSDAILAYDAMGVFTHLMNHYAVEHLPDWQSQRAFLANNPPAIASGEVTFAETRNTPAVKTVLLLQIGSGGISYLDKKS